MKEYLIACGIGKDKLIELEIFDYLVDILDVKNRKNDNLEVTIAGNLSPIKSGYIYKLIQTVTGININLYGPYFSSTDKINKNIIYKGSVEPDKLPFEIQGDFGLIWDGDEIITCSGITGNYLRYNNPHKTSLFLVAGMPIIVWEHSAMRDFVENNGVGIVIDDLNSLEEKLLGVSDEEYISMKRNVKIISNKLREGYYTSTAIERALNKL